jgi:hypothetical protein
MGVLVLAGAGLLVAVQEVVRKIVCDRDERRGVGLTWGLLRRDDSGREG